MKILEKFRPGRTVQTDFGGRCLHGAYTSEQGVRMTVILSPARNLALQEN